MSGNPLDVLSISYLEMRREYNRIHRPRAHPGVCVCGHGHSRHTENVPVGRSALHDAARLAGRNRCIPSKNLCPCPAYQEVLHTSDSRHFLFQTVDEDKHALSLGIVKAVAMGSEVEWLTTAECIGCHRGMLNEEVELTPVAYNRFYIEDGKPSDMNVLICDMCRHQVKMEWAGNPDYERRVR